MQNVGNTAGEGGEVIGAKIEKVFCGKSTGKAIYFNIDNEILYQRPDYTSDIINVEYFDASEREIKLIYDAEDDPNKVAETVIKTTGSNSWKAAIFYLEDAYFSDRQEYNADFRLECSDTMAINIVRVVPIDYYIDFGVTTIENLITQKMVQSGDSMTEIVIVDDEECITTTDENQYIYCDVDDGEIFEGDFPEFFISVEYWDSDPKLQMRLQYDSTDDPYKSMTWFQGNGWGCFRTYTWEVTDGLMAGRQNDGADFRINIPQPGLKINRIFLGLLDYGPSKVQKFAAKVTDYQLGQNYPNPFNPTTFIQYKIAHPGATSLQIFNSRGELVRTLLDGHQDAGVYQQTWDGLDNTGVNTPSGLYIYRLTAKDFQQSRKMIKLK